MVTRLLFLLFVATGIGLSAYLLDRHFELAYPLLTFEESACTGRLGGECDEALESGLADQLGIPLAGWGLVYYGTLLSILMIGKALGPSLRNEAYAGAFFLSIVAAIGSIVLVSLMIAGRVPYCPLCLGVHAVNLAIVPTIKLMSGQWRFELFRRIRAGAGYLFGRKVAEAQGARWKLAAFLFPVLMGVVLWQWVLLEDHRRKELSDQAFDPATVLTEFAAAPVQQITIDESTPTLGPPDAPVQIVVFSDFDCAACRRAAVILDEHRQKYGDKVRIVFKNFPLGSDCNVWAPTRGHPHACGKAKWGMAFQHFGKFWDLHDSYFKLKPELLGLNRYEMALKLGIDDRELRGQITKEEYAERLRKEVAEGGKLGVRTTPTFFINGRELKAGPRALDLAIAYELKHAEFVGKLNTAKAEAKPAS